MNTNRTYMQLGDGFEFILPQLLPVLGCATLPFMANAIYDFATNEWIKYGILVYDKDCVQYQWRSAEMESRRQNFDDVPVYTCEDLVTLGYLRQRSGSSAYLMNKDEYSKRRVAFTEKVKTLPTTINLGVDDELKAIMDAYNDRKEEREAETEGRDQAIYKFRDEGITYVQLGDGFEFIIDRPYERLVHILKLSATTIYDMVEKKWMKYRSTMYKVGDQWHAKFIANAEDRKLDLTNVPRLTYADLVTLGYMTDSGEDAMARYRFDYTEYKRRRRAINIICDDREAHCRELGNTTEEWKEA